MSMKCTSSRTMQRACICGRGFSLLEIIVSMIIMSVIAAVIMPIIMTATDAYTSSREVRSSTDRVLFALERSARFVREVPFKSDESGLDILSASSTQFMLTDGTGLRLQGSQLELVDSLGAGAVLCDGVDRISFQYFDKAGNSLALIQPSLIHRVSLQIQSGSVVLTVYAMPRSWVGRDVS
ncbi:MAG: type II secretion system protein [Phycisphaerales bacterium]